MAWVRSRHDAVGDFEVGDAGRDGAVDAARGCVVEGWLSGDTGVRRLEAVYAAIAGGNPDGAAGVGAGCEWDETGADGVSAAP